MILSYSCNRVAIKIGAAGVRICTPAPQLDRAARNADDDALDRLLPADPAGLARRRADSALGPAHAHPAATGDELRQRGDVGRRFAAPAAACIFRIRRDLSSRVVAHRGVFVHVFRRARFISITTTLRPTSTRTKITIMPTTMPAMCITRTRACRASAEWPAALAGLTLHSTLDGIALAASVAAESAEAGHAKWAGLVVFLVVFLHQPFDSMTLGTLMAVAGRSAKLRHLVNGLYVLAIPLGVVLFYLGAGLRASISTKSSGRLWPSPPGLFCASRPAIYCPSCNFIRTIASSSRRRCCSGWPLPQES